MKNEMGNGEEATISPGVKSHEIRDIEWNRGEMLIHVCKQYIHKNENRGENSISTVVVRSEKESADIQKKISVLPQHNYSNHIERVANERIGTAEDWMKSSATGRRIRGERDCDSGTRKDQGEG